MVLRPARQFSANAGRAPTEPPASGAGYGLPPPDGGNGRRRQAPLPVPRRLQLEQLRVPPPLSEQLGVRP